MTIDKTQDNEILTLALEGRLDSSTAPRLQEVLISAIGEAKTVVMDFTKLTYLSSAGLRALLLGQKEAKAKGVSTKLKGVSEGVMNIFDMTGFSDFLDIEN
jgi:anti-anti-sigma factor